MSNEQTQSPEVGEVTSAKCGCRFVWSQFGYWNAGECCDACSEAAERSERRILSMREEAIA